MLKLWKRKKLDNYERMYRKVERYRSRGVIIGKNCRIWGNLDAINPHVITIGDNVCLAEGSQIITHCPVNPGPVIIEPNCWIGFRAIILPNVKIGYGSLIGAGSVVTGNIPPFSIAAGNPARIIGQRDYGEHRRTVALMKTREPVGRIVL